MYTQASDNYRQLLPLGQPRKLGGLVGYIKSTYTCVGAYVLRWER